MPDLRDVVASGHMQKSRSALPRVRSTPGSGRRGHGVRRMLRPEADLTREQKDGGHARMSADDPSGHWSRGSVQVYIERSKTKILSSRGDSQSTTLNRRS